MQDQQLLLFDVFSMDLADERLWRNNSHVRLTPKAFALLRCLVQRPGQLMTKEELLATIWPDVVVSESVLTTCMRELRHALGDQARTPKMIETVHRRGYRFIAEVSRPSQAIATPLAEARERSRTRFCPACQQPNPLEAWFCTTCATPLDENLPWIVTAEPPTSVARPHRDDVPVVKTTLLPDAERRQLTVMFCDLVASTPLAETLDPEALWEVLQDYHDTCRAVIEPLEGHIAQYLGDGLLVYFGYPQAHEDDAQRAVRAGLGTLQAIESLNTRLEQAYGVRLAIRVGIHTGHVVIGGGRHERQEHLALGATLNIAARLQELAAPNTLVISDATYRLVRGYVIVEDLGRQVLRGMSSALQVFQVTHASTASGRLEVAAVHSLTPFLGRDAEMALLQDRWTSARTDRGQVVVIMGEAGIGKSRLVQMLKADIMSGDGLALECRTSPYHQYSALYPVIDLIKRRLEWDRQEFPVCQLEALEEMLRPSRIPMHETVPLFAALLSLPLPEARYAPLMLAPERQRQKLFEAIVMHLLELPERQPVLFILEDLHWADPSTLELLDLLIKQVAETSMLLLVTSRPEFKLPWGFRSHLTPITLHRLSRTHTALMVAQVSGDNVLPAELIEQLVDKTDGMPLFVEEMTKAVLESAMSQDMNLQGTWAKTATAVMIPDSLQDSLMARLDRLDTAKSIAQLAAIIGRRFSYDILQAVSPWDEDTLQDGLRQLVETELCYQRGILPQATYYFKHALIQEAAYESVLKRQRQHYHQQIAQALEDRFSEIAIAHPELIAHHYTQAALPWQAVSYWQRASQKALERVALFEAISHQQQGLDVLKALPETPDRDRRELTLQLTLGRTLMMANGFTAPEVEQAFTRARELSYKVGDQASIFQALRGQCRVYHIRRELRTAYEIIQTCLHLVQPHQDPLQLIEVHKLIGIILSLQGALAPARQHFEHALDFYEPREHRRLVDLYGEDPGVVCLTRMAYVLWQLGYLKQARQRIQAALELATNHDHAPSLAYVLNHSARLFQLCREWDVARDHMVAAISVAHERGLASWYTAPMAIWRGWVLVAQDQQEAGQVELCQGLEEWESQGVQGVNPYFLALWAETYGYVGNVPAGQRILTEAFRVVAHTEERAEMARLLSIQGMLHRMRGETSYPDAEHCFQEALALSRQQRAKSLELRASMGLSRLWWQRGKKKDAYMLLANIYDWFTEGFDTADLQDAKSLLADLQSC